MAVLKKMQFSNFRGAKVVGKSVIHTIQTGASNPVPNLWNKVCSE
jgi:hypothetical protein